MNDWEPVRANKLQGAIFLSAHLFTADQASLTCFVPSLSPWRGRRCKILGALRFKTTILSVGLETKTYCSFEISPTFGKVWAVKMTKFTKCT